MRRFYSENININGDSVILEGDEARHICTVLRMKKGDEVLVIDGMGVEYLSVIESVSDGAVELLIRERRFGSSEPDVRITLFQCLPKQGKMELIIQKCVELGVYEIVPTVSKRCVVRLEGKDNKLLRWNKVSVEAAKQCGRAYVPKVTNPVDLLKADFSPFDLVLLAYENEAERSLKSALKENGDAKDIAILIGPEGGFDPLETEKLLGSGALSVTLGKRILRTETAGMAMLSQILYELEG